MAEMLAAQGRISDKPAFINNVMEREKLSSTDTGIGVAIPHGKGEFVQSASIAICRFDEGVIWDDEPLKAVFLLAVNDDKEGTAHLEMIAKVSTMLIDDDFIKTLFSVDLEEKLLKEIFNRLEEEK